MTMTRPTSEQITHNGQILKDVLGPVFNVRAFGAVGDGATDDAQSINAAVAAAHSAGGGTVLLPRGTYLLGTTDATSTNFYIVARDNVSIVGDGMNASILKVKDNENARFRGTTGPFVIATSQATPLSNCVFADFGVDWNGANNLLVQPGTGSPPDTARNNASIFSLRGGINITCERIRITGTPGDQCIFFPAQSNLGQRNIVIRNCVFENNASAIAGNYCADHSSIYCNGDSLLYEGNVFRNDSFPPQFMAAYEIHGSNSVAQSNTSTNYHRAFWIASNYEPLQDITVLNDTHTNVGVGFSIAAQTHAIDRVAVRGCRFIQKSGLTVTFPSFFVNGHTIISCSSLAIEECAFVGQGYTQAFMQHQRIRDLVVRNNRISGFGTYGILSGNVDFGDGTLIDNLIVQGNVFTDVNRPVHFNTVLATRVDNGAIMISSNTFNRTVSDADACLTVQVASSRGVVIDNSFSSNFTTQYAGNFAGITFGDVRTGTYVPTVTGSTSAGTCTYTTQLGRHIRHGRVCTVTVELAWNSHTGTGNVLVSLPFACANQLSQYVGSVMLSSYTYTASRQVSARILPNSSTMSFIEFAPSTAEANAAISAAGKITATVTYLIA